MKGMCSAEQKLRDVPLLQSTPLPRHSQNPETPSPSDRSVHLLLCMCLAQRCLKHSVCALASETSQSGWESGKSGVRCAAVKGVTEFRAC